MSKRAADLQIRALDEMAKISARMEELQRRIAQWQHGENTLVRLRFLHDSYRLHESSYRYWRKLSQLLCNHQRIDEAAQTICTICEAPLAPLETGVPHH